MLQFFSTILSNSFFFLIKVYPFAVIIFVFCYREVAIYFFFVTIINRQNWYSSYPVTIYKFVNSYELSKSSTVIFYQLSVFKRWSSCAYFQGHKLQFLTKRRFVEGVTNFQFFQIDIPETVDIICQILHASVSFSLFCQNFLILSLPLIFCSVIIFVFCYRRLALVSI